LGDEGFEVVADGQVGEGDRVDVDECEGACEVVGQAFVIGLNIGRSTPELAAMRQSWW
jgi:hypothetical protein